MTESTRPWQAGDAILLDILDEVAACEGIDREDLPSLSEAIDPEALGRLVRAENVRIAFRYCGHEIVISNGKPQIDP